MAAWATVMARRDVSADENEPTMAGHLEAAMVAEKNSWPGCNRMFRIEEESGTRSLGAPKPDGRIDIKIICSFVEHEYLGIECKRVSGRDSNLARKYITEGIMRFVTGKYGSGHDTGAMLGIVVDGALKRAVCRLRRQIERHRVLICLIEDWAPETRFGCSARLYSTRHLQRGSGPGATILILHLLLCL